MRKTYRVSKGSPSHQLCELAPSTAYTHQRPRPAHRSSRSRLELDQFEVIFVDRDLSPEFLCSRFAPVDSVSTKDLVG